MSLVLRHKPETIGIALDEAGWVGVDVLLMAMKTKGHVLTVEQLEGIVASNDKQRFRLSDDKSRIRANQGHSLKLDLQLKALEPPETLYHGTAIRFIDAIEKEGLQKQNRHHVHLSKDKETAYSVGSRHGKPVILSIASGTMHQDGYLFYCSDNGVWLVDNVPFEYFLG